MIVREAVGADELRALESLVARLRAASARQEAERTSKAAETASAPVSRHLLSSAHRKPSSASPKAQKVVQRGDPQVWQRLARAEAEHKVRKGGVHHG